MTENEIQPKIQQTIENLLRETGFVQLEQISPQQCIGKSRIDLLADVRVNSENFKLIIEIKSPGEPRQVRATVQQLLEYKEQLKYSGTVSGIIPKVKSQIYGIVAAPYITEDSARICKENNIGYIDLAGNCFLKFSKVFIERKNYPNPYKEKRIVKSIFAPKASRILRVMLSIPRKSWQLQELAKEADVSLGQAYKVKERMLNLEYASEENKNIVLKRPEELLAKWSEEYSFKKNKLYDYFSFGEPRNIEEKIANYCEKNNITYALTLFSGLALVAPYARYTRVFVYIKEKVQGVVSALELRAVDSGPNITILEPYDDGVFYGLQTVDGMQVVVNIQLYLDLASYKGRGEESARFLLDQKIKSQW